MRTGSAKRLALCLYESKTMFIDGRALAVSTLDFLEKIGERRGRHAISTLGFRLVQRFVCKAFHVFEVDAVRRPADDETDAHGYLRQFSASNFIDGTRDFLTNCLSDLRGIALVGVGKRNEELLTAVSSDKVDASSGVLRKAVGDVL